MATNTDTSAEDQHGPSHGYQPRQLLLWGAGPAHLQVLTQLAAKPLVGVRITLIAPNPRPLHAAMLPGLVAGHYSVDDCVIPLEPLVRRGGIRWLQRNVQALDANAQTVQLDDGSTHHFDWLSVDSGPVLERDVVESRMPGAREHALFLHPKESFAALWPRMAEMGATRPMRIAIEGVNALAVELAFAIAHRLPNAAVTLLSGAHKADAPQGVHQHPQVVSALRNANITVLPDSSTRLSASHIELGCGASLACDAAIVASDVYPPASLQSSGLKLDAAGLIEVDDTMRSTSHVSVFACGAFVSRQANAHDGATLARNLAAAGADEQPHAHKSNRAAPLLLLSGQRSAIGIWGKHSARGRWLWWLKDWWDRKFVQRYRITSA
jgi:NADH dehydrogenase FAD-containing subunit